MLNKIKLIVLDVDGTMTDGGVYIDNNRIETKKFNIKDGLGIILAQNAGLEIMILTGRSSNCVAQRAKELNIKYTIQGVDDKVTYLNNFLLEHNLKREEIAYIGDDLNDLPSMKLAGISICPSDACTDVKEYVDICLKSKGGEGAVREFIEILLRSTDRWNEAVEKVFGEK